MLPVYFDAFTRFGPQPRQHSAIRWTLEHLVEELKFCSISGALVTHCAQWHYDAMLENRRLLDRIRGHDFLFPIWCAFPHWTGEMPEPADLLKEMSDRNVRAVMLNTGTNGWSIISRTSRPLLDALEKHRVMTILDANESDLDKLEQVCIEHPELPVVLRHAKWAQCHSVVPLLLNYKNFHITLDHFQVNLAPEWLVARGCENQLLYASNATYMSAGAHRLYVDYADISPAAKAKIAGGNLTRLLKGLKPPREIINHNEDEIMAEARQGKPLSTLVIDMHAHMLDEGLQGAGAAYTMWDGGPSGVRNLARRMGINRMGIMSWNGTVGAQAQEGNQCVTTALDAYPDFYWGLGTFDVMHLSAQQMRAQMETLYADNRYLGLKPYPSYGIPYNDPRYDVWWQFGNERHLYAGLHPVNWYSPGEFDGICPKWPNLTVVAFHSGGDYSIADTTIELARKYQNFMLEITLTPSWGGIIEYLAAGAGVDRVMYGSDLPMRDPRQQLGWVVYSRLNLEDKKKVLGGNAQRLLEKVQSHQA